MRARRSEQGFTLIELLVVILIIAILAAIAIPIFIRQREKAYVSHVRSSLKNAATSIEAFGTSTGGIFTGVSGADSALNNAGFLLLEQNGYRRSNEVRVTVDTTDSDRLYCITAYHSLLETSDAWQRATYNSADGAPSPADADSC